MGLNAAFSQTLNPVESSLINPKTESIEKGNKLLKFVESVLKSIKMRGSTVLKVALNKIKSLASTSNGKEEEPIATQNHIPLTSIHKMADKEALQLIKKRQIKGAFECRSNLNICLIDQWHMPKIKI